MRILILILFLFCGNAFAQSIFQINTGYGYVTDNNGHIIGKYSQANKGPLTLPSGYIYTEVADQSTLNSINLYAPPPTPQQQQWALNQQALQAIAQNYIIATPTLASQQATITTALSAQGQTQTAQTATP